MIRRRDIPGGMNKRESGVVSLGGRVFEFQHRVLRYYFPLRFLALYPIYMAVLYVVCCDWIWNDLNHQGGALRKTSLCAGLLATFPVLWAIWMTGVIANRIATGPARRGIERAPTLSSASNFWR